MTHETCWELLPWMANGRLDAEIQESVSGHVEQCGACRAELQIMRGVRDAVRAERAEDPSPVPSAAGFQRVLAEIDRSEEAAQSKASSSLRGLWWAAAAILVVAMLMAWQRPVPYRTLSAPQEAIVAGPKVRVLFTSDTSTEVLQEVLGRVQGRIVDGPNSVGAYVVALPPESEMSEVLEILRSHPGTKLVEPIRD